LKKWILAPTTAFLALVTLSDLAAAKIWTGRASYYALRGRTASGAHVGELTAAHRSLPFGSRVKVTNLRNNRSVVVVINDRGPFTGGRVIDVSAGAAERLGFRLAGVTTVKVETVSE
jgi:rare lipoprotein A